MNNQLSAVCGEVNKVIIGKETVVEKVLMAMLADGHILLDDVPGVGKTTLAVAFARAIGLNYSRIQFTPDVLPSDIVGFSMYQQQTGEFRYMPGAVTNANLVLADEINRTSSKTQSALLEAMEERQVTVDGAVHPLPQPFLVIATENQVGAAGTQLLPHAQLDRFRQTITAEDLLELQRQTAAVIMKDSILEYITRLAAATRSHAWIQLGVSPRGAIAVSKMARACAMVRGRDYVIPEDVQVVFTDVCTHRILLSQKAKTERKTTEDVLAQVLRDVAAPTALD